MQELQEFFQFSRDILNWQFISILICVVVLGLTVPDAYTKPFRSVRNNIWLFLIIAVASSIGTFLPQNKPAEEAVAKFGPFWAKTFEQLGFFDIYHTWWFALLLALMAFNVVVCKLRRLPLKILGAPRKEKGNYSGSPSGFFSKATQKTEFNTAFSVDETEELIQRWLKKTKLRFQTATANIKEKKGESVQKKAAPIFYAGRHYGQRWGDFILHISIVVVLAGNLLGAMLGFEEALPVMEGSRSQMENRPFQVALKDFEVDYYKATGVPSVYASDIEVLLKDKVLGKKRIVVNDPLDIEGIRFYQASWGMTDQFRSAKIFILGNMLEIKPGEITQIPGVPFSIRANKLLPTFDINQNGQAITQDYEGKNLALQVDFLDGKEIIGRIWMLKDQPQVAFRIAGQRLERTAPPPFRLARIDPVLFSGLQIAYDPGASIFWVGSLVLLFGLCLHFYWHQRRIRILVLKEKSGSRVMVGGWNSRIPQEFEKEFSSWMLSLKNTLKN